MKKLLLFLIMGTQFAIFGNEWEKLLNEHSNIIENNTYRILIEQYNAYKKNQAPKIADTEIKQIPIIECGEELVDLKLINHPRIKIMSEDDLIKVHKYKKDIDQRSEKHSMIRKSVFEALERMIVELDKLARAFGYEKGDLEIRIFEGLRDIKTQKLLFDEYNISIKEKNPNMTEKEIYQETAKWVSPYKNNTPVHSTGAAVDMHLWNKKTNTFCDMGRFNVAVDTSPTFSNSPEITIDQKKNRLLFLIAAMHAGLTNYIYEFWHYSFGDRYSIYWNGKTIDKKIAIYDAL